MKVALISLIQLWFDDRAQDMVEYALLAGFITLAATGLLPDIAQQISVIFSKMTSVLARAATA